MSRFFTFIVISLRLTACYRFTAFSGFVRNYTK